MHAMWEANIPNNDNEYFPTSRRKRIIDKNKTLKQSMKTKQRQTKIMCKKKTNNETKLQTLFNFLGITQNVQKRKYGPAWRR